MAAMTATAPATRTVEDVQEEIGHWERYLTVARKYPEFTRDTVEVETELAYLYREITD